MCAAFVMVFMVISYAIIYISYRKNYMQMLDTSYSETLYSIAGTIDSSLDLSLNNVSSIRSNPNVLFFINYKIDYAYPNSIISNIMPLYSFLEKMKNDTPTTHSIDIYSKINNFVLSTNGSGSVSSLYDESGQKFLKSIDHTKITLCSRDIQSSINAPKEQVISVLFPISPYLSTWGLCIYNISCESLAAALKTKPQSKDGLFNVRSSNGELLYSFGQSEIAEQKHKVFSFPSEYYEIEYEFLVPQKIYDIQAANINFYLILIGCAGFILSILLSLFFSYRISSPLVSILNTVNHPELWSDKQNVFSGNVKNETEQIINSIFGYDSNSKVDLALRTVLLKKAQSTALQSQITPHFLYNTLQIINLSAQEMSGSENETSEMIVSLADMLRHCFITNDIFISISDEFDLTEKYIEIIKYRFSDIFDTHITIPQELKERKIIKLLLQPIVENAVLHGIIPAKRKCILKIAAYTEGNKFIIRISNNGVPIPVDTLRSIRKRLSETMPLKHPSDHVGIESVDERLKLAYGENYGLSVKSDDFETSFYLTMPNDDSL